MNKERKKILEDLKRYANEGKGHLLLDFEIRHILTYINQLQQENQQLKKQKDDAVEYIKKRTIFGEYTIAYPGILNQDEVRKILRMLGEIDETDNLQ